VEETEAIEETEETEAIEETEEVEETEKSTEETEVAEETETEEVKESETEAVETEVIEESETEVVETEEVKETEPETQVETEVVETEPATEAVTEPAVEEPTTKVQETEPTESLLPDVKPSDDASSIITKLDIKVEETEEDAPINDEFIDKSQSDEILNVIGSHNEVDSVGYNTLDVETVKLDSEIDVEQGLAAASVINNAKLSEEKHIGYKGQTFHLNVLNGSVDNIESSNDAVASINSDGTISLNKVGKASITVESNGKTMSCEVLCANPEFDDSFINIEDKGEYQLEVNGNLQGQKPKFTLLTKNVEGASLTKDGLLTVPTGKRVKVRVEICGKKFTKTIQAETKAQTKWKGMQEAIEYCLGTPYVLGGFTPKVALDCSGYCSYVYNTVGLMSGRTTAQGLYNMCKKTDKPEPGDLVFFQGTYNCGDFITHVGLYAGDGMMYHSGSPNQKVAITGYYQQHFVSYGTMTH
jgi:cell wall-associated NlpC family hydrolase